MTTLYSLLPDAVASIRADSKPAILTALADCFSRVYDLDAVEVLERIEEREKLGSTGFGRGVAIPHARVPGLKRPVAVCFRLENSVDFDAADGLPVDLIFGLLSPEQAGATHLQALAAISRLVRDEALHTALVEAKDQETLFALLSNVIDRNAA